MLLPLHGLLRQKGTRALLLLFAVIAVSVGPVSSAGTMELGELDANHRCVAGKMGGIPGQGGRGLQDVTADGGQTVVKLEGTPKATFRAMVRTGYHLDYDLVADYEEKQGSKCGKAIKGLVEAEGCVAGKWHGGNCNGGKCTGGRLRVACKLSEVKQVQEDSAPTGYSVTDVTVWSSEGTPCLAVSAKFTDTDKNFCYLVPSDHLSETSRTVWEFMGRTITTSTTEATTTGTTEETTTEKTTSTETNTVTEVASTTATSGSTTTAKGPTTVTTHGTTAKPTNTDEPATGPTTKDPAGFRLAWYYWVVIAIAVVVVLLAALAASAYVLYRWRRGRAKQQKDDVDVEAQQSDSTQAVGKTTKEKAEDEQYEDIEGVKKEDTKDGGHEQVKSGPSHHLTSASSEKSKESGEKKEDEKAAKDNGYEQMGSTLQREAGIIVPDTSSMSEAPAAKKETTNEGPAKKETTDEGPAKKETTDEGPAKKETTNNGYEQMGSTLQREAGIIVPDTSSVSEPPAKKETTNEGPAKKETTDDGYEKLDDVV